MTRNQLKYMAYVSMLIDHTGHVLFPTLTWMRWVGRFAAPLFFYFAAVSIFQTRSKIKYLLRLAIFALISEPFFNQMVAGRWAYTGAQNVYFTIFLGVSACCAIQILRNELNTRTTGLGWMSILFAVPFAAIANYCKVDYKGYGVFLIVGFFCVKEFQWNEKFGNIVVCALSVAISMWQGMIFYQNIVISEAFLLPPKEENEPRMSKLWYAFYPIHIAILIFLRQLI